MNNLMLDIETIGHGSNAAIVQIAAVFFAPETGEIGAEFEQTVSIESAMQYGEADPSTIAWWMKQEDQARQVFNCHRAGSLEETLLDFREFVLNTYEVKIKRGQADLFVWGNGCGFDNVILKNAYKAMNSITPWPHWNDRDVRTMVGLSRDILKQDFKKEMAFDGVKHNALDDAIHQARYVSAIYQGLAKNIKGEQL